MWFCFVEILQTTCNDSVSIIFEEASLAPSPPPSLTKGIGKDGFIIPNFRSGYPSGNQPINARGRWDWHPDRDRCSTSRTSKKEVCKRGLQFLFFLLLRRLHWDFRAGQISLFRPHSFSVQKKRLQVCIYKQPLKVTVILQTLTIIYTLLDRLNTSQLKQKGKRGQFSALTSRVQGEGEGWRER